MSIGETVHWALISLCAGEGPVDACEVFVVADLDVVDTELVVVTGPFPEFSFKQCEIPVTMPEQSFSSEGLYIVSCL